MVEGMVGQDAIGRREEIAQFILGAREDAPIWVGVEGTDDGMVLNGK